MDYTRRPDAARVLPEEIIRAVAAANRRTVVCFVAAGAVLTEAWRHEVPAIVMMWYAGMEGPVGPQSKEAGAAGRD